MQKLQMTQKSLAAQIGMSYRHLNRLLNTTCKFPADVEIYIEHVLGYETSFFKQSPQSSDRIQAKGRIKPQTIDRQNPAFDSQMCILGY